MITVGQGTVPCPIYILVLVNGEYVVVEKIQHELLESPIHVYNFNVAGFHTYYVTGSGVLVHNICKVTRSNYRAAAKRYYNTDAIGQEAHHIFPQKYESYFSSRGMNIHSPQNIQFLDVATHRGNSYTYNKLWEVFIQENPNASYETVRIAGRMFMDLF